MQTVKEIRIEKPEGFLLLLAVAELARKQKLAPDEVLNKLAATKDEVRQKLRRLPANEARDFWVDTSIEEGIIFLTAAADLAELNEESLNATVARLQQRAKELDEKLRDQALAWAIGTEKVNHG